MTTVDYPPPPSRFIANDWLDWVLDHPVPAEAMRTLYDHPAAESAIIGWALGQRLVDR